MRLIKNRIHSYIPSSWLSQSAVDEEELIQLKMVDSDGSQYEKMASWWLVGYWKSIKPKIISYWNRLYCIWVGPLQVYIKIKK